MVYSRDTPFSPSDTIGDLEMSFIENNSFVITPSTGTPAPSAVPRQTSTSSSALSNPAASHQASSINSSGALQSFLTTPFKHSAHTDLPSTPGTNLGKTPALPKSSMPTLKEQERIIDEAKRENFGLKMKIFYLEERMQKMTPKYMEEALKENVDFKIKIENLEQELLGHRESSRKHDEIVKRANHEKSEQLKSAVERYHQYEAKIQTLEARLHSFEAEIHEGKNQTIALQNKLTLSKQREESIIETLNSERHANSSKQKEYESLFEEVQAQINSLQQDLDETSATRDKLQDELAVLSSQLDGRRSSELHLEDELKSLSLQLEKANKSVQEKDVLIAQLNLCITEKASNLEEMQNNLLLSQNNLKQLQASLNEKTDMLSESISENEDLINSISSLNETLKSSSAEIASLKKDLASVTEENEELLNMMDEKLQEFNEKQELIATLNTTTVALKNAMTKVTTEKELLESDLDALREACEAEKLRSSSLSNRVEQLMTSSVGYERQIGELSTSLRNAEIQLEIAEQSCKSLESRLSSSDEELRKVSSDKFELAQKLTSATSKLEFLQKEHLSHDDALGEFEQINADLLAKNSSLRQANFENTSTIAALKEDLEQAELKLLEKTKLVDSLKKNLDTIMKEKSSLEDQLMSTHDESSQHNAALGQKIRELNSAVSTASQENSNLAAQLASQRGLLEAGLQQKNETITSLKEELENMRLMSRRTDSKLQDILASSKELENNVVVLEEELLAANSSLNAEKSHCVKLEEQIKTLDAQIKNLESELLGKSKNQSLEHSYWEEKNRHLAKELEIAKSSISSSLEEKESIIRNQKLDFEKLKKNLKEKEIVIEELERQLESVSSADGTLEKLVDRLREDIEDKRTRLTATKMDYDACKAQLSQLQVELARANSEIERLNNELSNRIYEKDRKAGDETLHLRDMLNQSKEECKQITKELQSKVVELETVSIKNHEYEFELKKLSAEKDRLMGKFNQTVERLSLVQKNDALQVSGHSRHNLDQLQDLFGSSLFEGLIKPLSSSLYESFVKSDSLNDAVLLLKKLFVLFGSREREMTMKLQDFNGFIDQITGIIDNWPISSEFSSQNVANPLLLSQSGQLPGLIAKLKYTKQISLSHVSTLFQYLIMVDSFIYKNLVKRPELCFNFDSPIVSVPEPPSLQQSAMMQVIEAIPNLQENIFKGLRSLPLLSFNIDFDDIISSTMSHVRVKVGDLSQKFASNFKDLSLLESKLQNSTVADTVRESEELQRLRRHLKSEQLDRVGKENQISELKTKLHALMLERESASQERRPLGLDERTLQNLKGQLTMYREELDQKDKESKELTSRTHKLQDLVQSLNSKVRDQEDQIKRRDVLIAKALKRLEKINAKREILSDHLKRKAVAGGPGELNKENRTDNKTTKTSSYNVKSNALSHLLAKNAADSLDLNSFDI